MHAIDRRTLVLTLALFTAGGVGATAAHASGAPGAKATSGAPQLSMPDWMKVDKSGKKVTLEIVAGKTDANNHWNFNGYTNGGAHIVVPEGYAVEIHFQNKDPRMAHSMGIEEMQSPWPAAIQPNPVFDGAVTSNPTMQMRATQPNESETVNFTADKAGKYGMVCYIPGHAVIGMWIHFDVSADGQAGVQEGA